MPVGAFKAGAVNKDGPNRVEVCICNCGLHYDFIRPWGLGGLWPPPFCGRKGARRVRSDGLGDAGVFLQPLEGHLAHRETVFQAVGLSAQRALLWPVATEVVLKGPRKELENLALFRWP
jgi:hypothetical protein